ncbi:MAG TPA: hypothetical protein VNY51_12475 [Candidatus Dormibacteraeota bacterium]|jgi:hypothetical protein|nr:hypothetical protein [Candidatus Dormibacteraeota bacterium]
MPRQIDLIRASKLPSNMMQFAAKGALSVPADENIEILVYLAKHNKIFGDLAKMTLAGWDEKSSLAAVADPKTPREVLDYFISPENLRPKLLPALLENPSVADSELAKFAISASRESIAALLQSPRVRASLGILNTLRSNPYLRPEDASAIAKLLNGNQQEAPTKAVAEPVQRGGETVTAIHSEPVAELDQAESDAEADVSSEVEVPDEAISAYLAEHAPEIAAEKDKPFQPVGGIVELLGTDYFPVSENREMTKIAASTTDAVAGSGSPAAAAAAPVKRVASAGPKPGQRDNSVQKINRLDVKGRIQLAMKGNKEERSILIRDGTKVVALAVLDAPKLSDGEVEKFALQKNVLEAVLRQIPLKRRFMKNYIVVRNLVSNPRTPLDLGLGLMKHLQTQDLKNISGNKEVSETVRKLALKMYKQKVDAANKK